MLALPLLKDCLVGRNHTVFLVAVERMKNRKRGGGRISSKLPQRAFAAAELAPMSPGGPRSPTGAQNGLHQRPTSDLYSSLYGPPVLGSSLILLFEEYEISSPVAFVTELVLGKMVALNKSTDVAPTTSKTITIAVNRAQCSFAQVELAL